VGPLFHYELVRLARKGHGTSLRCAYALALLAALVVAHHPRFRLLAGSRPPMERFPSGYLAWMAEAFAVVVVAIQFAAVLVLTPAYLAGTVVEERERGTLDLLFTTHLTDREIVLGKLGARMAHLTSILLAGLPLLAIAQLWGGIDIIALPALFLVAVFNAVAVGSVCVLLSVRCRTVTGALFASYGLTGVVAVACFLVPYGAVVTSLGFFEVLRQRPLLDALGPLLVCVCCNGLVALVATGLAVVSLRVRSGPRPAGAERTRSVAPAVLSRVTSLRRRAMDARPPRSLPPVGERPLLWKEMLHGRRGMLAARVPPLVAIGVGVLLVGSLVDNPRWNSANRSLAGFPRIPILVAAGVWCVAVAFRAAAGVSRERDRATLDGLLVLPVSRAAILGAKWLGPVLREGVFGVVLAAVIVLGLLGRTLHPVGAVLLVMAVAAHIGFLASLGVLLSVVIRTTSVARMAVAVTLLGFLAIGSWMLYRDLYWNLGALIPASVPLTVTDWNERPWRRYVWEVAVNIPEAWWFFTFTPNDYDAALKVGDARFVGRLIVAVGGILAYALAARVLWGIACTRFRGEQRR
jgi:ABC-type transport system involved in multi-copper enzyme maturation permease subunit